MFVRERDFTCLMLDAIRALAGRQVTSVHELYDLMTGGKLPHLESDESDELIAALLCELGYVERWVRRIDEPEPMRFMFIRDAWPIDHLANANRPKGVFVPAY